MCNRATVNGSDRRRRRPPAISTPFRTADPPRRFVAWPNSPDSRPVRRPVEAPLNSASGSARTARPTVPGSCRSRESRATCSSPTYCAVRSRRESISSAVPRARPRPARPWPGPSGRRLPCSCSSAACARCLAAFLLQRRRWSADAHRGGADPADDHCGDGPRRASQLADIAGAEQQRGVAERAALVEVHQLRSERRQLLRRARARGWRSRVSVSWSCRCASQRGRVGLGGFGGAQVALDLQRSQLARPASAIVPASLSTSCSQRLDPLVDPTRRRRRREAPGLSRNGREISSIPTTHTWSERDASSVVDHRSYRCSSARIIRRGTDCRTRCRRAAHRAWPSAMPAATLARPLGVVRRARRSTPARWPPCARPSAGLLARR